MKICTFLLLLVSLPVFAQLGDLKISIVKDSDGFVNVREKASGSSKILDQLPNNTLVYYIEESGPWVEVIYKTLVNEKSGFIYKDRLLDLNQFKEIQSVAIADGILFKSRDFELKLTTKPFNKNIHKLTYHGQALTKIEGKLVYGTDGRLPKVAYKTIELKYKDRISVFPANSFTNFFEPNLYDNFTRLYIDTNDNTMYLIAVNSDGAGGYLVIWTITDFKYKSHWVSIPF